MGAGFSYLKSMVYKRKEVSLEDFYVNRFGKVLYRMFFESYTEKVWGRHPSQMSAEWGAQRVKAVSYTHLVGKLIALLGNRLHTIEIPVLGKAVAAVDDFNRAASLFPI